MEKYLVTFEFRYAYSEELSEKSLKFETITIGVFGTFEEACIAGNKNLGIMESKFPLNTKWNKKERFSKTGGCFGLPNRLITNLGYLKTPFDFYAKIETLHFEDLSQKIEDILKLKKL